MFLNLPGLRNSNQDHWQSVWERQYPEHFLRVIQDDWEMPQRTKWVSRLQEYIARYTPHEVVLVGHSVGCATVLHWYQQYQIPVKAALLVAPSDVDHPQYPSYIQGFSPMPLVRMPFPTVVVASDDDHVISLDRAQFFADSWGSELELLNRAGHIEVPWNGAEKLWQSWL